MLDKQQLHHLILLSHEVPVDPEMLARIDKARAHPSAGISHDDVLREFGL